MSKFCTSCGASLDDNATFCTACGTKLAAPAAQAPAQEAVANNDSNGTPLDALMSKSAGLLDSFKNSPNRNTYLGIGASVIGVILIVIILVSLLSGGYKGALKDYFGAIEDKDSKAYAKSIMSGDMIDTMMDKGDLDKDEFYDMYKGTVKSTYSALKEEFGSDIKIDFDVTDKEKIDDDELEAFETLMGMMFKDMKVSKGYMVELEIEVEGDDDDDTFDAEGVLLKVDGDWIVASLDVEGLRVLNTEGFDLDSLDFDVLSDLADLEDLY